MNFDAADGNFKLQRLRQRDDPDDIALNGGNAYFVPDEEYREYVKIARPTTTVSLDLSSMLCIPDLRLFKQSTCAHLRAARQQNLLKFKGAEVSGVVALMCARHGFYLPQGMVDLLKGEA